MDWLLHVGLIHSICALVYGRYGVFLAHLASPLG
jgi:hypothetical protein